MREKEEERGIYSTCTLIQAIRNSVSPYMPEAKKLVDL